MYLEVLDTIFLNSSISPFHPELRIRSIRIFVVSSFVVISNVIISKEGRVYFYGSRNDFFELIIDNVFHNFAPSVKCECL